MWLHFPLEHHLFLLRSREKVSKQPIWQKAKVLKKYSTKTHFAFEPADHETPWKVRHDAFKHP